MLGYATIGTNDLDSAGKFYDAVLNVLGAIRVLELERGIFYGKDAMQLGVMIPFDGKQATTGNGSMIALQANDRAEVDKVHAKALELGASNEGSPGLRGDSSMGFYGAYFRDPEGNKVCIFRIGPD